MRSRWLLALLVLALAMPVQAADGEQEPSLPPGLGEEEEQPEEEEALAGEESWIDRLPEGFHGFAETRVGPRVGSDPAHSEEFTLAEIRLQAEYERSWKGVTFDARGDLVLDAVTDEVETDLRQLRLTFRPWDSVDLRVGRQIMTWGTGDLLFINDLFPKDWQSFLIGRDEEYLKAPADAVRVGWFGSKVNLDLVYVPQFEPDRFIRGERLSFFDPLAGGLVGDAGPLVADVPDDAFTDDELALRLYGLAGSFEIAGYAYTGFWKSPAGRDPVTMRAVFPELDVLGASGRGPVGPGIGNVEAGYYDSGDEATSELRMLVGYELELARELTGGFQYYVERLVHYGRYLAGLPPGVTPRDENRHVLTARLTKLLKNQTVIPSLFVYYSPSDRDGYLRPKLTWKRSALWTFELGANAFFGDDDHTFFGQFENNSNVFAAARFSF